MTISEKQYKYFLAQTKKYEENVATTTTNEIGCQTDETPEMLLIESMNDMSAQYNEVRSDLDMFIRKFKNIMDIIQRLLEDKTTKKSSILKEIKARTGN